MEEEQQNEEGEEDGGKGKGGEEIIKKKQRSKLGTRTQEVSTKKKVPDPRDRTGPYQENVKYRRTTIAKKWGTKNNPGTMQRNAELFSRKTGLHVHITVFDPKTKNKMEFRSSNMATLTDGHAEEEEDLHQPQPAPAVANQTFEHHSPANELHLPPPITSAPSNLIPTSSS